MTAPVSLLSSLPLATGDSPSMRREEAQGSSDGGAFAALLSGAGEDASDADTSGVWPEAPRARQTRAGLGAVPPADAVSPAGILPLPVPDMPGGGPPAALVPAGVDKPVGEAPPAFGEETVGEASPASPFPAGAGVVGDAPPSARFNLASRAVGDAKRARLTLWAEAVGDGPPARLAFGAEAPGDAMPSGRLPAGSAQAAADEAAETLAEDRQGALAGLLTGGGRGRGGPAAETVTAPPVAAPFPGEAAESTGDDAAEVRADHEGGAAEFRAGGGRGRDGRATGRDMPGESGPERQDSTPYMALPSPAPGPEVAALCLPAPRAVPAADALPDGGSGSGERAGASREQAAIGAREADLPAAAEPPGSAPRRSPSAVAGPEPVAPAPGRFAFGLRLSPGAVAWPEPPRVPSTGEVAASVPRTAGVEPGDPAGEAVAAELAGRVGPEGGTAGVGRIFTAVPGDPAGWEPAAKPAWRASLRSGSAPGDLPVDVMSAEPAGAASSPPLGHAAPALAGGAERVWPPRGAGKETGGNAWLRRVPAAPGNVAPAVPDAAPRGASTADVPAQPGGGLGTRPEMAWHGFPVSGAGPPDARPATASSELPDADRERAAQQESGEAPASAEPRKQEREESVRPEAEARPAPALRRHDGGSPAQAAGVESRLELAAAPQPSAEGGRLSEPRTVAAPRPLQAAAPVALPAEPARGAAPMRDLSLRLEGAGQVEVRFTERAGHVDVAVRAADADLAGALRQDLGELSSRLDGAGYRAEEWRPEHPASRPPAEPAGGSQRRDQPNSQQQQQQQGRQSRRQQDSQQGPGSRDGKDFEWLVSSTR